MVLQFKIALFEMITKVLLKEYIYNVDLIEVRKQMFCVQNIKKKCQ